MWLFQSVSTRDVYVNVYMFQSVSSWGIFIYVCACVCVMFQCFLSKYFYQGCVCVCVMFQDVSTRGMSSFCISDCFYPGTVDVSFQNGSTKGFGSGGGFRMFVPEQCGCFVFQNVSTRGVSVGALCFRMFLPGWSVSEWGPVQARRLLHLYVWEGDGAVSHPGLPPCQLPQAGHTRHGLLSSLWLGWGSYPLPHPRQWLCSLDLFNTELSPEVAVGTDWNPREWGKWELYITLHCHHQNDSALSRATMRTILIFVNCEVQNCKVVSTNQNFWRERRHE